MQRVCHWLANHTPNSYICCNTATRNVFYFITLLLLQMPLLFTKLRNTKAVYRGPVEQVIWLRQVILGVCKNKFTRNGFHRRML
jgi:hypothetical protein